MTDGNNIAPGRVKAPIPAHVPQHLVVEIDMYQLDGIEEGYQEAWKRLQGQGVPGIVWTPHTGGHWIVTKGELVREIYADPTRFSSEVIFLPKEAGEKYTMVPARMDPPEHTPYRKALDRGLNIAQMKAIEDKVRAVAAELIAAFADKGECEFSESYARVFPVRVFMALADLPMEDAPLLSRLAAQMTRPDGETPEEMAASLDAANRAFFAYVDPVITQRIGGRGEDLITLMVNSDIDGEPLSRDKALGLVSLLLLAGLDTVVNLLGFMMIYLGRSPERVAELRAADPMKLHRATEEIFRRFPVVSEARMVAKDIDYHGVALKQGDMILLPTVLHGLDETMNPDPWTLNPERRGISHSTFGGGPHRCAGMHLARLEVKTTLEEWFKKIPEFSLRPGSAPVYLSGIVASVDNVELVWPTTR